jgi:hypothetical protein
MYLSNGKIRTIADIWILAAIGVSALFPIFGVIQSIPLIAGLVITNVLMIVSIIRELRIASGFSSVYRLYIYQGVIFVIVIGQGFVGR